MLDKSTQDSGPQNSTKYLSVLDVITLLRRWWWMLLVPLVLAVGAAGLLYSQASPVYQSEAEVLIRTEESANLFPLSDSTMLLRSPSAEAGFLASTDFEQAAMAAAGSDNPVVIDVGDLSSRVEPSFISFRARESSPQLAASVAQTWADTYIRIRHSLDVSDLTGTIGTLETRLAELDAERAEHLSTVTSLDRVLQLATDGGEVARLTSQRLVLLQSLEPSIAPIDDQIKLVRQELAQLRVVGDFLGTEELNAKINRTAETPDSPVAPSLPLYILVALVLGLAIGGASALLAETLDDRMWTTVEVSESLGLQSLASVPFRRKDDLSPTPPFGQVAESFHRLASAIDFAAITGSGAKVLMFTSAQAAVSKTTTVSRLGATLARQGRRTLVIGADLRLPTLAWRFDHTSGPGLGELLGGLYPFSACVTEIEGYEGLSLLPAGTVATEGSPVDLLRTQAFSELIEELRPQYDHILIDCPPVLPVVDALEITRVCDGIIMNIFAGKSRLSRVERALSMIDQATRKPVLGFVLTGSKGETDSYNGGYYGYGPSRSAEMLDIRREAASRLNRGETRQLVSTLPVTQEVTNKSMPQAEVASVSIDDVELVGDTERNVATVATASTRKEKRKMRALRNLLAMFVALTSIALAAPAGAQYEGDAPESGVLTVPTTPGPDAPLSFVHTGLKPLSELTFTLENADGDDVDGLEVRGAVVVRTDANGNYDGDITIPSGLGDGVYTLIIAGTNADDSPYNRTYAISLSDGGVTGAADSVLALTGSSSRSTALNGALIILVGLALVAFAARTRSTGAVSIDT